MKKTLIILSGLLLLSMISVLPVSASDVVFRATGTLDEYIDSENDGAVIVSGSWHVEVNALDDVGFAGRFVELNINEEIIGTRDQFKLYFRETTLLEIDDSHCVFEGILVLEKKGWDYDGTDLPPLGLRRFGEYPNLPFRVMITSATIVMELWDGGVGLWIPIWGGTTHSLVT